LPRYPRRDRVPISLGGPAGEDVFDPEYSGVGPISPIAFANPDIVITDIM